MLGITIWQLFFLLIGFATCAAGATLFVLQKRLRWIAVGACGVVIFFLALLSPSIELHLPQWIDGSAATATATSLPTATVLLTNVPTNAPTATQLASVCTNIGEWTDFSVVKNMDVGDPGLTSIVYANKGGEQFISIIEKSYNLDFEAPSMSGKFLQTDADITEILCIAKELATETNTNVKFYVGAKTTPDGWTKIYPQGWKMSSWVYQKAAIEVPGANWQDTSIALVGNTHSYGSEGTTYCQLWDGSNASLVFHIIVEPGKTLNSSPLQGTCWTVAGGEHEILYSRFAQMTDEVILRDNHPEVTKIFVGKEENKPTGWSLSLPTGWSFQ